VLSRETLYFKPYKERACRVVLSQAKSAGYSDTSVAFENMNTSIENLHSGKLELTFAKEFAMKAYKNLLSDLKANFLVPTKESIAKFTIEPAK
jgi:hypothetical protein